LAGWSSAIVAVGIAIAADSVLAETTTNTPSSTATNEVATSVTLTTTYVSEYMFRGIRLGGSSFQPSVEFARGNLTVGLWANLPIADSVPGQSDPELDPYISYTFNVNDQFSIVPGFAAYTYPNADTGNGFYMATYEPNLAVNYTIAGVKLTPKVYYDVIMQGPTFELNAAYSVPLEKLHTELDFTCSVGTFFWNDSVNNASPRVKNTGSYYLIGVALPFSLADHLKFTPGVAYTEGFDNHFEVSGQPDAENGAAVGRVVATISLNYTF
jgi:uncharacterized protein (TIGR02001 family)